MSDHEIIWTFEDDHVAPRVVCHADPQADCRLKLTCLCEDAVMALAAALILRGSVALLRQPVRAESSGCNA